MLVCIIVGKIMNCRFSLTGGGIKRFFASSRDIRTIFS